MSQEDHFQYVVEGHQRPVLRKSWSTPLRILMKRAWEPNPKFRPSMDATVKILKGEIISLRGASVTMEKARRRPSLTQTRERSSQRNLGEDVNPVERRRSLRKLLKYSSKHDVLVRNLLERARSSGGLPIFEQSTSKRNPAAA